jgi:predicted kinase
MQAIVFCGIQASGKSSFFRERFFNTHVRLSLDLFGTRNREDILLHACLASHQAFVVDNTNVTSKARSRYLHLARAAGFRCNLYYFESSLEDALRRNVVRPEPYRVPDIALRGTMAKLEVPTSGDGFDEAFRVRLCDSVFAVETLR